MENVSSSNGLEKRPKLRFPGFDEPWKMVSLQDISEYRKNKICVSKSKYISTENMLQNFAGIIPYTSEEDISGVEFCVGDTLLANIRPYLRKAWLATHDGACSTDVLALCPLDITPAFLNNIIEQDRFIDYVMSGVKGSKMPRGDKAHILAYETAIPSLLEQEKINSFMQLLHQRIAKIQMEIELLKKYKRGLLHDVLSEKIKITTETWTEHRIGEFLHSKSIKQLPTTDAPLMAFTATGGVCDKGERYDRGFLVKDASSKLYKRTDLNDFIYSSNNLDVGSIGLNLYGSAVISDVYEIFSIKDADPWFISEAIKQKPIMSRILKYRQGCLYGQYRIYAEDFLGVFVKIPSYEAQKKIGAVFSKIDGKIMQEQILLDCLEKARTFFLQQLFI